jgi:hypothetical protein
VTLNEPPESDRLPFFVALASFFGAARCFGCAWLGLFPALATSTGTIQSVRVKEWVSSSIAPILRPAAFSDIR